MKFLKSLVRRIVLKVLRVAGLNDTSLRSEVSIEELCHSSLQGLLNHYNRIINDSKVSANARLYEPYCLNYSTVGDFTYIAKNSHINFGEIGKYCSIGPNVIVGWGIHPIESVSTSPMFYSTIKQNGFSLVDKTHFVENKPIKIGNDVFIGMNVTILDGVVVGDGAVIGAGAIVTKDVPPYAVVVGNPARILRYRFTEEQISKLLEIKWWDKEQKYWNEITNNFYSIEGFLEASQKPQAELT